jgi:hypothetical protein
MPRSCKKVAKRSRSPKKMAKSRRSLKKDKVIKFHFFNCTHPSWEINKKDGWKRCKKCNLTIDTNIL